jgi:hypothetical protein
MVMQPLETWRSGVGTQLRRTPLRLLLVAVFPFVVRMLPPCRPWAVHTAVCSSGNNSSLGANRRPVCKPTVTAGKPETPKINDARIVSPEAIRSAADVALAPKDRKRPSVAQHGKDDFCQIQIFSLYY